MGSSDGRGADGRFPKHATERPSDTRHTKRKSPKASSSPSQEGAEGDAPKIKRLGEYRIVQEIGRGGMGTVFEAVQESLDRRVALKVMRGAAMLDEKAIRRFHREAESVAQLHHPNIVPVYTVGEETGTHYYAMELVPGVSLAHVIYCLRDEGLGKRDPFDPETYSELNINPALSSQGDVATVDYGSTEPNPGITRRLGETQQRLGFNRRFINTAVDMIAQAADALQHAHEHGVVHRDVKPSNLMLAERGKVMLTDFGLARQEGTVGLTVTEDFMGTPMYMSPEQALGGRGVIDLRTDIYSLGATLYELVTLSPLFDSTDPHLVLRDVATKEPRTFRQLRVKLPNDLELVTTKAIEKDPDRRYQSAKEFADDLRRFLSYEAVHAKPVGMVTRGLRLVRRQRRNLALAGSALFVILAVVIGLTWRWNSTVNEQERQQAAKVEEHVQRGLDQLAIANSAESEEESQQGFEDATQSFTSALAIDSNQQQAIYGLEDLYLDRARRAIENEDFAFAHGLLIAMDNLGIAGRKGDEIAKLERRAVGTGTWRVQTVPPKCKVELARIGDDFEVQSFRAVGTSPVDPSDIPMGSYIVRVSHPGHSTLDLPMFIERNEDEKVVVQLVPDGQIPAGMVYVPAGEFHYGDEELGTAEKLFLPGFFIDRTEVTGADYEKFVQATDNPGPDSWRGSKTCPSSMRDSPVYNVSWFDAVAYAAWAGKRLPTEQEWEKAARGVDGRTYPWGNRFEPDRCNWRNASSSMTAGRFSAGASVFGCLDMAGNVWDWTVSREEPFISSMIMRGGASYSAQHEVKSFLRQGAPLGGSGYGALNLIGFRCVKSLVAQESQQVFDLLELRSDFTEAAEYYYRERRTNLLKRVSQRMLDRNPRSVPGLYWKHVWLEMDGDNAGALEALKAVYMQTTSYRATVQATDELIKKLTEAGEEVDESFREVPGRISKARSAIGDEKYEEAEEHLDTVIKIDTEHDIAHELMGDVCAATDRPEAAARHYEYRIQALRIEIKEEPGEAGSYNELAWFLFEKKMHLDEALKLSQRSLELSPQNAYYLDTLAELEFLQNGDANKALTLIQQAIDAPTPRSDSLNEHLRTQLERFKTAARTGEDSE